DAIAIRPYSTRPSPPTRESRPSAARTTVGSTPHRSAHPAATPATTRSELRATRARNSGTPAVVVVEEEEEGSEGVGGGNGDPVEAMGRSSHSPRRLASGGTLSRIGGPPG